jgi:hypothetical protein
MGERGFFDLFDPRRFFLLLRRDFIAGYRGLLVMAAAVGGAVFVLSVLSAFFSARDTGLYFAVFGWLLFLGGYIYTGSAFRELHQAGTGPQYLMLPGSTLEKLVSKVLASSVGYAAAVLLVTSASAAVSELVDRLLFGTGHRMFDPFDPVVYRSVALYLVTSPVFLLGSVWFKRLVVLKTALSISVLFIGLAIVAGAVTRLLFSGFFAGPFPPWRAPDAFGRYFSGSIPPRSALEIMWKNGVIPTFLKLLFWAAMPAACWLISYLRLAETEA